jgi:Ca2+-binding EF-hand superfamily protein
MFNFPHPHCCIFNPLSTDLTRSTKPPSLFSRIPQRINHTMGRSPVSQAELIRLKKRFMKLDKDGSGSIDRDEFLQIPQIANNPLAHRMIAIFDSR